MPTGLIGLKVRLAKYEALPMSVVSRLLAGSGFVGSPRPSLCVVSTSGPRSGWPDCAAMMS